MYCDTRVKSPTRASVVERLGKMLHEIRRAGSLGARAEHRHDASGDQRAYDIADRVFGLGRTDSLEARLLSEDRRVHALKVGAGLGPERGDRGPARVLVRL